ncbi:MAG: histidine phosphatase family protein [Aerococcus sp.]|nr:histidine phosphatase family protein [Aerococcus sp.]
MTATIYLVRHGQTTANYAQIVQGWQDSELTPAGIAVADGDGDALRQVPFAAAYASDLIRAVETAKHILAKNEYLSEDQLIIRQELREVSFGTNQGAYGPAMQELLNSYAQSGAYPYETPRDELAAYINSIAHYDPKRMAEDFQTFSQRIIRAMTEIAEAHDMKDDTILVVSHGMMIRTLYTVLFPRQEAYKSVQNGAVSRLSYHRGKWQSQSYNEKLTDLPMDPSWF